MDLQKYADIVFLALTIWREARGEPRLAQVAIAHVVLTRAKDPKWWGGPEVTSCLFKPWQFSSLTDPCDKQLTVWPGAQDKAWKQCLEIAQGVLEGKLPNPTPGADSYHDISVRPSWATKKALVGQVGKLRFYNAG